MNSVIYNSVKLTSLPFSRLSPPVIRAFEEEWKTTDVEGYLLQHGIVRGIENWPPSTVRNCFDKEHYVYLYGACWGLDLRNVTDVSLISLLHVYESFIGRKFFGGSRLRDSFISSDVTRYASLVEEKENERFFMEEYIILRRLSTFPEEIPHPEALRDYTTLTQHPLFSIILAAIGVTTEIGLAKFFTRKSESELYHTLFAMQSEEEIITKYKVVLPKGVTALPFLRDNILEITQEPYMQDRVTEEGYLPAFRSVHELYRIYNKKLPSFHLRDGKPVRGYENPTTAEKLTAYYVGIPIGDRASVAQREQVARLRSHFTKKTAAVIRYVQAVYDLCVKLRRDTYTDKGTFFAPNVEATTYYYSKLDEEEKKEVDTFPYLLSFFEEKKGVTLQSRVVAMERCDVINILRTCCTMYPLLDLSAPLELHKVEYIF